MMHDASHALHVSFVLLNFFTRRLVMVQILHFGLFLFQKRRRKRRRRRGRRGGVWDAFDFLLRNMWGDPQVPNTQTNNKGDVFINQATKSKSWFTIHVYVQKYELEGGQTQTLVRLAGLCWHFPWGQTRSLSYCYFFIFNAIYLFICQPLSTK